MIRYVSNKGGGQPVDFKKAILDGYAYDGGLYVPEYLPKISKEQLESWKEISYQELAFEIISLFVDRSIVPASDLREIINTSYNSFEVDEVIPLYPLKSREGTYIMELFYGPTLSFKDIGQSFLINLLNYFLVKDDHHLSVIVATTGDTGPAAAQFIAGKSNLDAWVLYPKGMITEAQERQMTTLHYGNIHPVGVTNCPEGGDDLDAVIHRLYANDAFKAKVHLSSVNSINWGRIMVQMIHYFYGYLRVSEYIGEEVSMSVPSGGFGNLCAGALARKMGLPIKTFIIANNLNDSLNRIFTHGICSKAPMYETISSAIDILIPYNFWRYLYYCIDQDPVKIKKWSEEFESVGAIQFDETTHLDFSAGFLSQRISDETTIETIENIYKAENYLLDPHGSVAVSAVDALNEKIGSHKVICMATAHPAKFPVVIKNALKTDLLPPAATHHSIENAKKKCQKMYLVDQPLLEEALIHAMESHWDQTKEIYSN